MANGEHIEVAKAYVTIVPSLEGSQKTITEELTGITSSASEKAGSEGGSKFGDKFASAIKGASAAIATAVATATAAAVATGKAFIDAAKDTAAYGDTVDKQSQKVGFSAASWQSFDYVLKVCGTEMSSMTTGIKTLTNKLDDAKNGSEDAQAMFASLGLSMEELSTLSREDLFRRTIEGFQQMEDSTERAALANDLFGKSGQNLAPLFNMTTSEMDALIQKSEDLGMVMSDDGVKNAAAFTDSMTTLKSTFTGFKNNIMSSFMPGLTSVTEGISKLLAGKDGIGSIKAGLKQIISQAQKIAPDFFALAETLIMSLLEGFGPMLPQIATTIFNVLNQGLLTVVGMLPQLMPAITSGLQAIMQSLFQCMPIIIQSLLTLVTDLVTWLSSGSNIKLFVNGIVQLVSMICDQISVILPVLLPAIVQIISEVSQALTDPANVNMILESVLAIVGAIVVALVNSLPAIGELVVQTSLNITATLKDWGSKLWSWLYTWLLNLGTKIISFTSDLKDKIHNWFTNLLTQAKNRCTSLVSNVMNIIKELPGKVLSVGKNLVEGLWNGINDKIGWVKNKISGMGSQITSAIKKVFGIASPSKIWRDQIGSMLAEGIGVGFTSTMDDVKDDMVDSMSGLTGSMTTEVKAYGDTSSNVASGAVYNGGNITMNIYGAEGQNVNELAQVIAVKLDEMTRRKELVYG